MYFLEKLCRICVQPGLPLVDINTVDFDTVKLSEKLEVCARMAISKDVISSKICEKCVNKLRVSYHFLDMCKKSTKIIQGYLEKLIGPENSAKNYTEYTFLDNSQLNADVERLPDTKFEEIGPSLEFNDHLNHKEDDSALKKENHSSLNEYVGCKMRSLKKKQRITKEQRCSLLQRLLNRPKKERDKPVYTHNTFEYEKGSLKNIIDFAKNYEFSFKLDKNSNIESTPLDKLTAFSTDYFRRDFTDFRNHILYIIENRDRFECSSMYSTDDEDFISGSEAGDEYDEGGGELQFEEIMVEPDIKIKSENMDGEDEESQCPLDYLETSFEEEEPDIQIKNEPDADNPSNPSNFYHNSTTEHIKEEENSPSKPFVDPLTVLRPNYKSSPSIDSSPAVKLLDKLVSTYPMGSRKVFSASNVRCRTRDQPYINPVLKNQFLHRSFRCDRCNRYFKSQGYLKAHTSKVH